MDYNYNRIVDNYFCIWIHKFIIVDVIIKELHRNQTKRYKSLDPQGIYDKYVNMKIIAANMQNQMNLRIYHFKNVRYRFGNYGPIIDIIYIKLIINS